MPVAIYNTKRAHMYGVIKECFQSTESWTVINAQRRDAKRRKEGTKDIGPDRLHIQRVIRDILKHEPRGLVWEQIYVAVRARFDGIIIVDDDFDPILHATEHVKYCGDTYKYYYSP
jgi:hypothetical protein